MNEISGDTGSQLMHSKDHLTGTEGFQAPVFVYHYHSGLKTNRRDGKLGCLAEVGRPRIPCPKSWDAL